jgi:hypothetical protein
MTVTQKAKNVNYVTWILDLGHVRFLFSSPQQDEKETPCCSNKRSVCGGILQHFGVCDITAIQFADRETENRGEIRNS